MSPRVGLPSFPGEVVTSAHVRLVDLPRGAGRAALITLDNGADHTRPTTLGPAGLAALDAAIDEVLGTPGLAAVAVTGKPFTFCVGADLHGIGHVTERATALALARAGHAVFRRLGELPFPSFAFINGAAMGGGLEVALNCTYRTISNGPGLVGLPEVSLGLVPGWGGAYLLPSLIGAPAALDVIVRNPLNQNRLLKPAQALDLGIVDALFEAADFLEQSCAWAAGVLRGDIIVTRPEVDRGPAWLAAVAQTRAWADSRTHGATLAPGRACDLVADAAVADRDAAFAAEDEALADLVMGDQLRASLYAFDLVQRRAKRPQGAPDPSLARPVTRIGVIGAGLMARQLAWLFLQRCEVPVLMTDLDQERLDAGLEWVRGQIAEQLSRGRMSPRQANRLRGLLSGSLSLADFAGADLVIEAVAEQIEVKRRVFAELEGILGQAAVLATNTSSLSVAEMAAHLAHPQRVVGLHFFNPVAVMPLVEIARGPKTDEATLATAFAMARTLGKSAILVQDAPAFVVNRLLMRFLGEIMRAVDEGTPVEVADHALDPLGLPMTPVNLIALVGPGVAAHVSEELHARFPDRFYRSENLRRLAQSGRPSIYDWSTGTAQPDPVVLADFTLGSNPLTGEQVRERALTALADEVRRMLDEGVVSEVADIDLAMIIGAGWPFWLGGLSPYLDRSGASERATGSRFLPPGVASVPA